ncbi:unnamed protein product [Gongylonema pulchrum]|uniref:Biogenesis of lysosome-related organelles complex 1 subunit 3 n=1 Tax=Gongylonema pulchrum TaxID=637853 RepID=A0A183EBL9_9BILA|nr:unnamed protein product [Gongylonema pulchrum]
MAPTMCGATVRVMRAVRKSEQPPESTDKKPSVARPSELLLKDSEGSTDAVNDDSKHDEWYEMMSAASPSNSKADRGEASVSPSNQLGARGGLERFDLEPDSAADIEALEQSLTALLDDFRSGRMSALGEDRLKMMRKARQEMENLTAFHVKLHKIQAPNFSTFRQAIFSEKICFDACLNELYNV